MPARTLLSVTIIARDEADRIGAALRSVAFADEVLVLDSGSTDDTVAVARGHGARVVETDWPGHVAQKNRAMAMASHPLVLSIDADEVVDLDLAEAVRRVAAAPPEGVAGWRLRRANVWLGVRLRGGGWYPDRRTRLAWKDHARWAGDDPHDQLVVDGTVAELDGALVHTPYRNLGEHLATIDRYSRRAAEVARARGRRGGWLDLVFRPPWAFFRGFVLRAGFRDGEAGLVVAALGAIYVLLKWSRIRGAPTAIAEAPDGVEERAPPIPDS
jgi:glycosyltransferase involved in cell wall biosynthesis